MKYEIEIDVEDLGIDTDDLISLAEDNGDRLFHEDEVDERIEHALEDKYTDLKEEIAFLKSVIEEMKVTAKASVAEREAIGLFVQSTMRIDAIGIADCIRRGDYNA